MPHDGQQAVPLGADELTLLEALLHKAGEASPWVEAQRFRRDHHVHRKTIDHLIKCGHIRKERMDEKECYCVGLTALVQMQSNPVAQRVLDTAQTLWHVFRKHYMVLLNEPLPLQLVAEVVGQPMERVLLAHAYMREWWHTPHCFTPAGSPAPCLTVQEAVLDNASFSDCIAELAQIYSQQQQDSDNVWAQLPKLGEQPAALPMTPWLVFDEPSWFHKLPPHAQALMQEIHQAKHAGLRALTAMGVRAVIDVVADDLLGEQVWGFAEKLSALRKAEHLSHDQWRAINAVVNVGHAAMHRCYVPDEQDIRLITEALNHMLFSAYGLKASAEELIDRTPPAPHKTQ